MHFVLRSRDVWLPNGPVSADLEIKNGVIAAIHEHGRLNLNDVHDVRDQSVLPGLVDTHVHLNEPGRTSWEGFETGTRGAKAGGITTLIEMPLNASPVTTTLESLRLKREAASGKLHVDVGFHAGLVPDSAERIDELLAAGTFAAKAFLCPSGIDEFPAVGDAELHVAMPKIAAANGLLMVHAEIPHHLPAMRQPENYHHYLQSRPPEFERRAIAKMIELVRQYKCRTHIVHLSDAGSLPLIERAQAEGLPLTVETCPHYLTFDAKSILPGQTQFKCAPPIRDADNRERLWEALRSGLIDMIVSDHSPCLPDMKSLTRGCFDEAWGGISSLELGLPVVWTEASRRGFTLRELLRWMGYAPADLVGITCGIDVGRPAHLVVFDPNTSWTVDQNHWHHRHPLTPYHGRTLQGRVMTTYVHGDNTDLAAGRLIS